MKKILTFICVVAMLSLMLLGCGNNEQGEVMAPIEGTSFIETAVVETSAAISSEEPSDPITLDDAIIAAIFEEGKRYSEGEASCEGHILMDKVEVKNQVICYLLTMYGNYEFENGNFVKCSGSGVIPAVLTFEQTDGKYTLLYYNEPEDGSNYVESIKDLFPENLWARCITIEEDDRIELERQERADAEEYIGKVGREDSEVGDYADFEYKIDSDYGLSDDVSNKISDYQMNDKIAKNCSFWYGDREVLEENIRYIYRKEYDKKLNQVVFSKVLYETGEVIEISRYSAKTGEPVE